MSDDKSPPSGFTWGLSPSDEPEDPKVAGAAAADSDGAVEEKDAAAGEPTAGLNLGHFLALNQTEMIAAATEQTPTQQPAPVPPAQFPPAVPTAQAPAEPAPAEPAPTEAIPHFPTDLDDDYDGEPTAAFDFRAPAPPPVDPIQPPVYHEGRALPWEQPPAFDASLDGATEVLGAGFVGLDTPVGESAPTSAIDSLFGEEKFQEYEDAPAQALVPFVSRELVPVAAPNSPASGAPKPPRGPLPQSQKVLIWVAGGLVAALAIAGLFFIGTRIGASAPDAAATPTPTPTTVPTAVAEVPVAPVVLGPVAPGVYAWNELLGTECIDPYTNAWEKDFTVVDCAAPHGGQMVYRGRFDDSALDAFPGVEALQTRMNLLCASQENIDYAAASQFSDIQIAASFPGTDADWKSGNRDYFCFVDRSSGEPLTVSVSTAARAPVVIPVVPAPEP